MKTALPFLLCLLALLPASRSARAEEKAAAAAKPLLVIKAGHLIDAASGTVRDNQAVVVEGERIKSVGPAADATKNLPPDARVIDLGGATLLPGLIDCHTHLTFNPGNYYENTFRRSAADQAVVAPIYARRTLEAGFTTVRDVGASEYIDFALRRAINAGQIPGPRMLCAGPALSATGGHGDNNGFSPTLKFEALAPWVVDGPEAIRLRIRTNVKYGADWI